MKSLSQQIYEDGLTTGQTKGRSDALHLIRLYVSGNSILQIAETVGEDEAIVRKSLIEAGLLQE